MVHMQAAGRTWSGKRIGAVLGTAAGAAMIMLPLASNAVQPTTPAPGSGVYSAFTPPPTMTEGATETTTTPEAVPATAKASPAVKAPHK